MAYHGLFIGIDRYASNDIDELSCAVRDATALYALFADSMGTGGILLTDHLATRQSIGEQFRQLMTCREDDIVVIFFSGHGSDTHELATFDADVFDLSNTAIPLETLTDWFAQIPAQRLICILDCCFSGGMGAKVLHSPIRPRNLYSANHKLEALSGEGRLIITASTDKEEAWENTTAGHGLLTYYLLQALQGAEEVRQDGRVSVYRLLEFVTQYVKSDAISFGKHQHPTIRGKLDDALTWQIFVPGEHYYTAFPERKQARATATIASLGNFGFPQQLLDKWAHEIPSLNQLQIDAINEFQVLDGAHLVVSAPTSSGKTMIGELAALRSSLSRKRSFFLLPMRALVNDKHQQFKRIYQDYGLRIIRATGEYNDDISALMRGQYDICLLTYEKFASLLLTSPYLLEQVGTVVIDEVQMIADENRGVNLEFLLTLIRVRRQQGIEPQIVALSAVIGDTNGLERWLGGRLLRRTERPVPLVEGVIRHDGSYRYLESGTGKEHVSTPFIRPEPSGKNSSQDYVIPLVRRLVADGKQVIVFRETKGETQGCAAYLARELELGPAKDALDTLPVGDLSDASQRLREVLAAGVAFHNANLERDERLVIEETFRRSSSTIRVIVATTTLAMGINTPAEAVIVVGLEHPGRPPKPYSVAEYKNIIGRAGRLGFSQNGEAYLLATSLHVENYLWAHYILGQPEQVHSRFFDTSTDPRSLVIRVLVAVAKITHQGLKLEEITAFLSGSFGAFQFAELNQSSPVDQQMIERSLQQLVSHEMVQYDDESRYTATELGQLSGETGVEVETVIRTVDALRSISQAQITEPVLIAIAQLSVELDNVVFPMNRKSFRPGHAEYSHWMPILPNQGIPQQIMQCLQSNYNEPYQPLLRAKKAATCLLWMSDIPLADIESRLTEHVREKDASAAIRGVKSRSGDVLPAVLRAAHLIHPGLDLSKRGEELLLRLELGIPQSCVELAMVVDGMLTRADYLMLANNNLASVKAIEDATDDMLSNCFEQDIAHAKVSSIRQAIAKYRNDEGEKQKRSNKFPSYNS